ncbi:universal stress protein [Rouxiella badensis]|jgi:nucleotide-binding universal stress UspA family protein|uniref:UspA domain-containing protein n=1 Tax=Rouxiella badensis TaxID=1646377 RepID=A0A1X0W9L3_9GAMM|nr:universal stress protein [Rouxiella badensis]ORJ23433.1 hypothetical protein BS640_21405 [Rouxiella badensis]QOI55691.1 universal stress protein [Rouxiella badensis subsp. acadiensis]WAT03323.1 universal stress protein [Rouxiella badensis]WAT09621.1 universal stress protein [Rouxiella badensis]
MFTHILVALDGSPQSQAVIALAHKISAEKLIKIDILCVVDGAFLIVDKNINDEAGDGLVYPPANQEYQQAQKMVNQAIAKLKTENRQVSGAIIGGEPTEVIIKEASRLNVDLIVMGHRHLSSLKRWVEHSIAKEVIDLADCPVLVENQENESSPQA